MSAIATKGLLSSNLYSDQGPSTERANVQRDSRERPEPQNRANAPMLSALVSRGERNRANVEGAGTHVQLGREWSEDVLSGLFEKLTDRLRGSRDTRHLADRLMEGFLTDLRSSNRDSVAARLEGRRQALAGVEGEQSSRTAQGQGNADENDLMRNHVRNQIALALERVGFSTGRAADVRHIQDHEPRAVLKEGPARRLAQYEPQLSPVTLVEPPAQPQPRKQKQVDRETAAARRMAVYEPYLSPVVMAMTEKHVPASPEEGHQAARQTAAADGTAAQAPRSGDNQRAGVGAGTSKPRFGIKKSVSFDKLSAAVGPIKRRLMA